MAVTYVSDSAAKPRHTHSIDSLPIVQLLERNEWLMLYCLSTMEHAVRLHLP